MWKKIFKGLGAVGAINWLLIGALNFNLLSHLLGAAPVILRVVYVLAGIGGIWIAKDMFE